MTATIDSAQATLATTPKVALPEQVDDHPANYFASPSQAAPGMGAGVEQADQSGDDALGSTVDLFDPLLALHADAVDDLERVRIATENRLRSLTQVYGLNEQSLEVARLTALADGIKALEHDASLLMQGALRKHPLGPWVKAQRGLGDVRMARLLAVVGDPYMNAQTGLPRTVSQLWAYCGLHTLPATQSPCEQPNGVSGGANLPSPVVGRSGHQTDAAETVGQWRSDSLTLAADIAPGGDPDQRASDTQIAFGQVAARRSKGQKANWSTKAKTRAWLNIESCMKQLTPACKTETGIGDHQPECKCSPYRVIVDHRRQWTTLTHPEWTPLHSLRDGMRIASKSLLRDLWREARRLHSPP